MLPRVADSTLLVVDIQERLFPAMHAADQPALVKQNRNLLETFRHFGGGIVYTEQYPRGLGPTIPELLPLLEGATRIEKLAFSVCRCSDFGGFRDAFSKDVVLTGIETHVCVLQTGWDLLANGFHVWVPFDAVASRDPRYRDNGLELLTAAGARVINTESLIFHELQRAGGDDFKRFSKLVK